MEKWKNHYKKKLEIGSKIAIKVKKKLLEINLKDWTT